MTSLGHGLRHELDSSYFTAADLYRSGITSADTDLDALPVLDLTQSWAGPTRHGYNARLDLLVDFRPNTNSPEQYTLYSGKVGGALDRINIQLWRKEEGVYYLCREAGITCPTVVTFDALAAGLYVVGVQEITGASQAVDIYYMRTL